MFYKYHNFLDQKLFRQLNLFIFLLQTQHFDKIILPPSSDVQHNY